MTVQATRKPSRYVLKWLLDGQIEAGGLDWFPVYKSTHLYAGDLIANSSGYAIKLSTGGYLDHTVLGVCAGEADNSSGSSGAISVPVIPLLPQYRFWLPVYHSTTAIAAANVGTIYDIHTDSDYVDISDAINGEGECGLRILDYDISTPATTVNTMGFALVRWAQYFSASS